ncbi:toxin-antitoxin system HicB family antitoxin [Glutamicibacter sp. JC586]|uniref:toxin-antitoxin system HicB family antitoxin n=1 Tax=Glutamicibacter sp. JC586 TaxID=2590552 RepID=UPI00351B610F
MQNTVADLYKSGEEVPLPFALREYSGNIRLRVSPQKHRALRVKASEHTVSLIPLPERIAVRTLRSRRIYGTLVARGER